MSGIKSGQSRRSGASANYDSGKSREVVVAQLPGPNQYFEGPTMGTNLTYGFYCRETNVFYECTSLEEYLSFQVHLPVT